MHILYRDVSGIADQLRYKLLHLVRWPGSQPALVKRQYAQRSPCYLTGANLVPEAYKYQELVSCEWLCVLVLECVGICPF